MKEEFELKQLALHSDLGFLLDNPDNDVYFDILEETIFLMRQLKKETDESGLFTGENVQRFNEILTMCEEYQDKYAIPRSEIVSNEYNNLYGSIYSRFQAVSRQQLEETIAQHNELYKIHAEELERLKDKDYALSIDPETELTQAQLVAIKIISKTDFIEFEPTHYTDGEKEIVGAFLETAQGDMNLNYKLQALAINPDIIRMGISEAAVTMLTQYSFRMRRANIVENAFERLERMQIKINANIPIPPEDKITLAEYGACSDYSRMERCMSAFADLGFTEKSPKLQEQYRKMGKVSEVIQSMEADYTAKPITEPGIISLWNQKKKARMDSKTISSFFNKISNLVCKYGHAASVVHNPEQGAKKSHILWGGYDDSNIDMGEFLYSDIYTIQIDALIPEKQQKYLQESFGDEWKKIVTQIYKEAERKVHDSSVERYGQVKAISDASKQQKAGLLSLIPFGLGHKKIKKNDFDDIHHKVMNGYYNQNETTMMCSSFTALTTIASLVEVDKQLKERLTKKGCHVPKKPIVEMPIGRHEKLSKIHPQRLIGILKSKNCVHKISHEESAKRFLKKGKTNIIQKSEHGKKSQKKPKLSSSKPTHSPSKNKS